MCSGGVIHHDHSAWEAKHRKRFRETLMRGSATWLALLCLLVCPVAADPGEAQPDGSLTQSFGNRKDGYANWLLDEATLRPLRQAPRRERLPGQIGRVESKHPGMAVRRRADLGTSDEPGVHYILRWETLPSNRDRPRPGDPPEPSMLRVYRLEKP